MSKKSGVQKAMNTYLFVVVFSVFWSLDDRLGMTWSMLCIVYCAWKLEEEISAYEAAHSSSQVG